MTQEKTLGADAAPQLDALNGMRFFAVFHIFLFHIWSAHFEMPRQSGPLANVYANLDDFPRWLNNLLAHGYLSTSFFFLLSGFILAYLYWKPDGAAIDHAQAVLVAAFHAHLSRAYHRAGHHHPAVPAALLV